MGDKKISLIIPVYKVEKYLNKCVESVVNQTYKNLEIILVDDGSLDSCPSICDEWAKKDERIIVIHQQNKGLSGARNTGIKSASGQYIGFIDSDDYIKYDMIELLYKAMEKYDAKIGMCSYNIEYEDSSYIEKAAMPKEGVYSSTQALNLLLENKVIKNFVWNKLYNIRLFDDISFPQGKNFEDIYVTYKLFLKAEKIAVINDGLYNYIQRKGSISKDISIKNVNDFFEGYIKRYNDLFMIVDKTSKINQLCQIAEAYAYYCGFKGIKKQLKYVKKFLNKEKKELPYFGKLSKSKKIQFLLNAVGISFYSQYKIKKLFKGMHK